jgi:transcriptional regulator with XRE-family HTH domain
VTPASLPGEEWRFVTRNRDYAVSSLGRVCRVTPYTATYPGRELRARVDAHGKATVTLAGATITVASLVAAAFMPPPPPGMALYHRDFDGTNNRVTNLGYATRREITIAACAHHGIEGERNPHARLSDTDMERIRAQRGARSAREIAAEFGIARGTVYQIQSGRIRGAASAQAIHPPALGERIKRVRTQRAMSATEMARHLGVTTSAVTAWERGEKTPRYPIRIATLLAPLEAASMAEDAHGRARSDEHSSPPTAQGPVRPAPADTRPAGDAWNVFSE